MITTSNPGLLIGQATKMLGGLVTYGVPLKITQVTPATFGPVLTDYIDGNGAYITARSEQQVAYNNFHVQDNLLSKWLLEASNVLAVKFGNRWSTLWAQAGFINNTTAIPPRMEDRIALALNVIRYLTKNPGLELPDSGITAAHGTELRNATLATQKTLTDAGLAIKTKNNDSMQGKQTLTTMMRGVVKILQMTLSKSDPRWTAFGLRIPSLKTTPGQPQNVRALFDDEGNVVAQCDALALASSFRWRIRVVGVDTGYRRVTSSGGPLAILKGLPAGQTIELVVQGVNGAQQGVASEPILIETSEKVKASAPLESSGILTSRSVSPLPSGNGNGNGHRSSNGTAQPERRA